MPIAVPQAVARYLAAIEAGAIFVSQPLHVGAGEASRLPRRGIEWLTWTQRIEDAQRIAAAPDLLWQSLDGVKVARRSVSDVAATIEQQAQASGVILTPHARAVERATMLSRRADELFASLQARGDLATFNHAYKRHRLNARARGENVRPYCYAIEQLRRVLIKALVEVRGDLSPLILAERIQRKFPWYC